MAQIWQKLADRLSLKACVIIFKPRLLQKQLCVFLYIFADTLRIVSSNIHPIRGLSCQAQSREPKAAMNKIVGEQDLITRKKVLLIPSHFIFVFSIFSFYKKMKQLKKI